MVEHGPPPPSFEAADSPEAVYENNPNGIGEIPAGEVPGRPRSIQSRVLLTTVDIFKKELRRPEVRAVVNFYQEQGFVVAAERQASEIKLIVAKNKKTIGLAAGAAGIVFGAHYFRKSRKKPSEPQE